MKGEPFNCAECGGLFEKSRSDADAAAEAEQLWGVKHADTTPTTPMAIVCDDCFQRIRREASADVPLPWSTPDLFARLEQQIDPAVRAELAAMGIGIDVVIGVAFEMACAKVAREFSDRFIHGSSPIGQVRGLLADFPAKGQTDADQHDDAPREPSQGNPGGPGVQRDAEREKGAARERDHHLGGGDQGDAGDDRDHHSRSK